MLLFDYRVLYLDIAVCGEGAGGVAPCECGECIVTALIGIGQAVILIEGKLAIGTRVYKILNRLR